MPRMRVARTRDERRDLLEQRHRNLESQRRYRERRWGGDERQAQGRADVDDEELERLAHKDKMLTSNHPRLHRHWPDY